ncbi:MAG TPA: hypothetical protein VL053_09720 [Arachidicoccus sp.]|nr:hypothetical protein [Arachidicoccus sp.]
MKQLTYIKELKNLINLLARQFIHKIRILEPAWIHEFLLKMIALINEVNINRNVIAIFKKDFCGKSGFIARLAPTNSNFY